MHKHASSPPTCHAVPHHQGVPLLLPRHHLHARWLPRHRELQQLMLLHPCLLPQMLCVCGKLALGQLCGHCDEH